jgi:hypothetical protein
MKNLSLAKFRLERFDSARKNNIAAPYNYEIVFSIPPLPK